MYAITQQIKRVVLSNTNITKKLTSIFPLVHQNIPTYFLLGKQYCKIYWHWALCARCGLKNNDDPSSTPPTSCSKMKPSAFIWIALAATGQKKACALLATKIEGLEWEGKRETNLIFSLRAMQAFFIYISLWLNLKEKWWPASSMHDSLFIFQPVGLRLAIEEPLLGKGGGERKRTRGRENGKGGRESKRVRFRSLCALSWIRQERFFKQSCF